MIIDADCHVSPTPEGGVSIDTDELLRRMDRSGVAKALTWLQPPYLREIDEANAYVYAAMKRHPDRILGFGWADPNLGVERAVAAARRCIQEYGFYGVKLNGAQNSFYIDDPRLSMPIIDEVARQESRLALHVGADAFERTHPFRVAKIAAAYPDLPILAVHMGGVGHADLTDAMVGFAQQHPGITLVGSGVREVAVLKAIRAVGASRVCFGSDTPFSLMHVEVAKYQALLDGEATPDERDLVMGGNIARLLGLL